MFIGSHFLFYSTNPDGDRAFLRDVLELRSVDAGGGWPIFKLPPAEVGVHPSDGGFVQRHADQNLIGAVLYFLCAELASTMKALEAKGVAFTPVLEADWGVSTTLRLPSGANLGLYQPAHPTAFDL